MPLNGLRSTRGLWLSAYAILLIHHPRGGAERYLTVSSGVASLVPPRELALEALINASQVALQRSKRQGKNSIATAEAADFQ